MEVTHNLRDGGVKGTLLQVLDKTLTPMGARLLKQWVESPLMDIHHIERRQRAITELIAKPTEQGRLRELLKLIFDFERILARVETGSVSPRDFTSLRESLRILPDLVHIAGAFESTLLQEVVSQIDCHADVYDLLNRAIAEQPALTLKDGRVIRDGFNQELDDLRSMATNSQEWLHRLEEEARSKTGIRLKPATIKCLAIILKYLMLMQPMYRIILFVNKRWPMRNAISHRNLKSLKLIY